MTTQPRAVLAVIAAALLFASLPVRAQAPAPLPADFESRVEQAMRSRDVPGMAISIVKDGEVVLAHAHLRADGHDDRGQ